MSRDHACGNADHSAHHTVADHALERSDRRSPTRRTLARRAVATVAGSAALVLPLSLGQAASGAPPAASRPVHGSSGIGDPYFPTYGNGGYDATHYDLAVRYDPDSDVLTGRATISAKATESLASFNLDLVALHVRSVSVNGRAAAWVRRGAQELVVTPGRVLRKGSTFAVTVAYDGVPVPFSDPSLGTYGFLTTPDGAIAIGEPQVAAHWYPVNDHPSDKATYRIALTVPKGVQAVSNGLPSGPVVKGAWATTTWQVHEPMASYLAFMAVGHFDIHRWRTASGIPVIDAVDSGLKGAVRSGINSSFGKQGEILAAESSWFGPYPFEAAGGLVDDVKVGFALENQTRPTYSPDFWSVYYPPGGDDVVVHELAHQWYGDSVALDRWQDVWLNEGFATYAEWLWTEREFGYTPQETFNAIYAEPAGSSLWHLRIGDPGPAHLFDGPVYTRGALTLQALRMTVGEKDFFAILKAWARVHRAGNGTTDQFIALSEKISGRPLDALFHAWLFTDTKPARPTAATADGESLPAQTTARRAEVAASVDAWRADLDRRIAMHPGRPL